MALFTLNLTSLSGNPFSVSLDIKEDWHQFWHNALIEPEFYQTLADNVINQPYVDQPEHVIHSHGATVYRPNHDVGHGLRQIANSLILCKAVEQKGHPEMKRALKELTQQECAALYLAAFLFRAARTNEHASKLDPSHAQRSAILFSEIAKEVGFDESLVNDIAYGIGHYGSIMDEEYAKDLPYQGFQGAPEVQQSKSRLVKAILDIGHHSDLVRCWGDINDIVTNNLKNLSGLLDLENVEIFNDILLNFARSCNAITGSPYFKHDGSSLRFMPPVQLRIKATQQTEVMLSELIETVNCFITMAQQSQLERSDTELTQIEQSVNEQCVETRAANTIKRAFRNHRAYKICDQEAGIVPPRDSQRSLDHLKNTLQEGLGYAMNEEAIHLNDDGVAVDEMALYDYLMNDFSWVLKHITPHMAMIQHHGNTLKSLHQRAREGLLSTSHTHGPQARKDNIFFTLSSSSSSGADFLQTVRGHEIRIPLRTFLDEKGVPCDKLSGLWISSSWYDYNVSGHIKTQVDGVKRTIKYVKQNQDHVLLDKQDYKEYHREYSDGRKVAKKVPFGFETVYGKDLLPFLALNTLEELRNTTPEFRRYCLENPKSLELEAFVDLIYSQHHIEAMIPATLPLNDSRIEVLPFNQAKQVEKKMAATMKAALDYRKASEVKKLLDQGYPVDLQVEPELTPLGYCLIQDLQYKMSGRSLCALLLIDKGANIAVTFNGTSMLTFATLARNYTLVEAILSKSCLDARTDKVQFSLDINSDESAILASFFRQDLEMLKLFHAHGLDVKSIHKKSIELLANMPEKNAILFFRYMLEKGFKCSTSNPLEVEHLEKALKICINHQKYRFLEELIKAGSLESGLGKRLLRVARKNGDEHALSLLAEAGVDVSDSTATLPVHVYLNIQDSQGRPLVFKRKHEDGSLSSCWQPIQYISDSFSMSELELVLFTRAGLRLKDFNIKTQLKDFQKEHTNLIVELVINDKNPIALDTDFYARPLWLSKDQSEKTPLSNLAKKFVQKASQEETLLAFSLHKTFMQALKNQEVALLESCLRSQVVDEQQKALLIACDAKSTNLELIQLLIDNHYDVNAVDTSGDEAITALMMAIIHENVPLIEYLIQHGANPNQAVGKHKVTPMMLAARDNKINLLQVLERNGASYSHHSNEGLLAYAMLHLCSDKTFEFLVRRANCDSFYFQHAPIFIAAKKEDDKRIKLLKQQNVDIKALDPETKKQAKSLYRGSQRDLLEDEHDEDNSNRGLYELSQDYKIYLEYSGAFIRDNIDEELANEYLLTIINSHEHQTLHSFLEKVVKQCPFESPAGAPVFAIAHEGQEYVRTCQGFSRPVISIHQDFFANESLGLEHLEFALAHELFLLEKRGPRQFNEVNASDRIEADRQAIDALSNSSLAFHYLQQSYEFTHRHEQLPLNEKPHYFYWPIKSLKDTLISDIPQRLKGLKLVSNLHSDTKEHELKNSPIPKAIRDEVQACQALNYFPEFCESMDTSQKLHYLKSQLGSLQQEFVSFVLSKTIGRERMASQKVRQFCKLAKKSKFDLDEKNELIQAVEESGLHSFEYIYKSIASLSPVHAVGCFVKTPDCLSLGSFVDMQRALTKFINGCSQKKSFSEVLKSAQEILKLLPNVMPHVQYANKNYDILNAFEKHEYEKGKQLRVESDIASFISWQKLHDFNSALPYLYQDKENCIWKILWMMGYYDHDVLFEFVPKSLVKALSEGENQSDLMKHGFDLFPFCASKRSYAYFTDAQKAALRNLRVKHKPDLSFYKGNFIGEFKTIYEANKAFLLDETSLHHRPLIRFISNEIKILLKTGPIEQAWVFKMYHLEKPIHQILSKTPTLKVADSPLIKVLLEAADSTNRYQIYEIINYLYEVNDRQRFLLFKKLLKIDEYNDKFSQLVAYTEFAMSHAYVPGYVSKYWEDYFVNGRKVSFNHDVMRILERFNQIDSATFMAKHISFEGFDFFALTLFDSILLYRILDSELALINQKDRQALTLRIRAGLIEQSDLEQRIFFLEQLVFIKESPSKFVLSDKVFLHELNQWLGQSYAQQHGLDDGTKSYFNKVEPTIEEIFKRANPNDSLAILTCFSNDIVSQELVSKRLGELLEPHLYDDYFEKSMNRYSTLTWVFSKIGRDYKDKEEALLFFSSALTEVTKERFTSHMLNHEHVRDIAARFGQSEVEVTKERVAYVLQTVHQMFWGQTIQTRAVLLDCLLITSEEETSNQSLSESYQFGFDFLVNKLFPDASTDEREGFALALLTSYLSVADPFERQFLLSGLLVTSNEAEGQKVSMGRKLALLCEHMGPAYVKLAQAIHSHPDTPQDIKQDLSHIKGRANPPTRWQLWRHLKETLPEEVFNRIQSLGILLGSASYNLAIACHFDGNENRVVTLLREHAAKDAEKGFEHLKKTLDHCQHPWVEKSKQTFLFSINEAQTLSHWEIDNSVSNTQFAHAHGLYQDLIEEVQVNDETYFVHFQVCDNHENGPGFKILTRMPGVEFNDLTCPIIQKAIAKAVVKTELSIILSGDLFDSDRHGCQYRVTSQGQNIQLGLYDFGEMSLEPMNEDELKSFAKLVKELPLTLKRRGSVPELFQAHIKKAVEEDRSYRHLMRVNKALLALNDFSQHLSDYDTMLIIKSILPEMHPWLRQAMTQGWYESSSYLDLLLSSAVTVSDRFNTQVERVRGMFRQFTLTNKVPRQVNHIGSHNLNGNHEPVRKRAYLDIG